MKDPLSSLNTTSESLIAEITSRYDSPRWNEFAKLYEPVLRRYVELSKADFAEIPEFDRDDIVQDAFLAVRKAMASFHYVKAKGKFRSYLATIVRNKVIAYQNARRKLERPMGYTDNVESGEIGKVLAGGGAEEQELMLRIWTLALSNVFNKKSFSPNSKAVFRRIAIDMVPVADVAAEFRIKPNAVYQIKNRVMKAVADELDAVRKTLSPDYCGLDAIYDALKNAAGLAGERNSMEVYANTESNK